MVLQQNVHNKVITKQRKLIKQPMRKKQTKCKTVTVYYTVFSLLILTIVKTVNYA